MTKLSCIVSSQVYSPRYAHPGPLPEQHLQNARKQIIPCQWIPSHHLMHSWPKSQASDLGTRCCYLTAISPRKMIAINPWQSCSILPTSAWIENFGSVHYEHLDMVECRKRRPGRRIEQRSSVQDGFGEQDTSANVLKKQCCVVAFKDLLHRVDNSIQ